MRLFLSFLSLLFLLACGGGGGATSTATVSYTTEDNNGSVSIYSASSGLEGTSQSIHITFSVSPVADCTVTLSPDSSGSYATYGSDYTMTTSHSVAAGAESLTVVVALVDDSVYELSQESYYVNLDSTTCGSITNSVAQGYISENSSIPTLSISSNSTVFENGDDVTVTVSQSMARTIDFGVALGFGGSATSCTNHICNNPNDYVISNMGQCDNGVDNGVWVCIRAGNTSTSFTLNPTMDYTSEGDETATISVTYPTDVSVSHTITIDEIGLETQTAFVDQGSSMHDAKQALTEYMNMSYAVDKAHTESESTSRIHEYEQLNIHKVWSHKDSNGQFLDGTGEYISIFDMGCDTDHVEFQTQKNANLIKTYGSFSADTEPSYDGKWDAGNSHCNGVAALAAADYKGATGSSREIMGVAYNAGLHFFDVNETTGNASSDWASALNDARQYKPVANNNSWYQGTWYDDTNTLITNSHGGSADNYWANTVNGGTTTQDITDWQAYITALDNFQEGDGDGVNGGIIVFAAGNTNSEDEPTAMSAMPLYYSQLAEAWLTVTYFENTQAHNLSDNWGGSFSLGSITRLGNQCGSTKEFCLSMDAQQINSAGAHVGGSSFYIADYWSNAANNKVNSGSDTNLASLAGGTSFAAPMLSGGIALLAQAFPNHNAEQLTDRILASANNSWFTPQGNTTFTTNGASINHGYHAEWGHGVPDFYAALQPIVNSSNPLSSFGIPLNKELGSIQNKEPLSLSNFMTSAPFGDGLSKRLDDETLYFYDALNGGFEIKLNGLINNSNRLNSIHNLSGDISNLNYNIIESNSNVDQNYSNTQKLPNNYYLSVDVPLISTQNFIKTNQLLFNRNIKNILPFSNDKGIGITKTMNYMGNDFYLGYHTTNIHSHSVDQNKDKHSISLSMYGKNNLIDNFVILLGKELESDSPLNLQGHSAFSLIGSQAETDYVGIATNKKIRNIDFGFSSSIATTSVKNITSSLINHFSKIQSNSYQMKIQKTDIFNSADILRFTIEQPHRIENGSINLRLPGLATSSGVVPYDSVVADLEPFGRQINLIINYITVPKDSFALSFNTSLVKDNYHIKDSNIMYYTSAVLKKSF